MKTRTLMQLGICVAVIAVLAGCGSRTEQKNEPQATGQETSPATPAGQAQPAYTDTAHTELIEVAQSPEPKAPPVKKATSPKTSQPKPAEQPKTVVERKVSVPAGSTVVLALQTPLRTDSNQVGDRFDATVSQPVIVDGETVIASGWRAKGRLVHVEEAHHTSGLAKMTMLVETIVDERGREHSVAMAPLTLEAEKEKFSDAKKVGAGAAVGGIIGALTSKKKLKGAVVGAAAGAAAGGAVALAKKGNELVLNPGDRLEVQFAAGSELPAMPPTASGAP